uniref:Replication associated protein n=1 Tax=Barley dwarf virus TaxID=497862 RepID=B7ZFT3_9GEMI|nr:replication associated protein [Barley dwarf virus]
MASSSAPRFRVYMYEGESFFAFGENVTASQ